MLSDQDIFNRYQVKKIDEFDKFAEITLIGHSLFDMWGEIPQGTPKLNGKCVANLGISGTSTRQYLDVIVTPHLISHLGDDVFIFLGVNDIVKEKDYSPKQLMIWLNAIIEQLRVIKPNARFYLLEATPVNDRCVTVDNPTIFEMNLYLKQHCPKDIIFIETWRNFVDVTGKLDSELSVDGLHFSLKGYDVLANILSQYLSKI